MTQTKQPPVNPVRFTAQQQDAEVDIAMRKLRYDESSGEDTPKGDDNQH